ncbi:MAG: GatB/YqeY domain-containing protein [Proteobacteria bacterium]|nr:GatB/YqeY domain-containing protein [Pseudomonadota bacterium]
MTTASLKVRITEDMKSAMRAGEKDRLGTIRMLQAGIKQREVDERISLDDAQVLSVIEKMLKQRKESIAQFEQGGRADLAAREQAEIELLTVYLPAQLFIHFVVFAACSARRLVFRTTAVEGWGSGPFSRARKGRHGRGRNTRTPT